MDEEEYLKKKHTILQDKQSFYTIWQHIQDTIIINFASTSVTGIGIIKSSNVEDGLWVNNMHNARNV